jgi:[protein-PII] uridylyltransferase
MASLDGATPPPSAPDKQRLSALRDELARERAALLQRIPSAESPSSPGELGVALGRKNARAFDALLTALFELYAERSTAAVVLAGVGSYGRGAVALRSDVDLRVLSRDERAAAAFAEALLYPLWDMGVSVGHQVVSIEELVEAAREDLPTATSLLDWRHVAGDGSLSEALRYRAQAGVFAHSELPRFIRRLSDEVAQRHARFGGSVYLLEPDVKNGAGGLRDLDVARWALKARYGASELEDMVRVGALLPREAAELGEAAEMLWRIRNILHAHAGRRSDRLTFDEQEAIAALLKYGAGGEAVERMMSEYYRRARSISRALDMILSRATPVLTRKRPRDEDLGGGVHLFDGCVTTSRADQLRSDPALALRLVSAAVERGAPLLPHARETIARATSDPAFCADLRASPEAARRFTELVATCKETELRRGSILRELHDIGLLLAMIPEFSPVVGRVHHDIYHVYTVDVHSVAAVDRLAALARGELAAEFPLACRLAAEITRPAMLFFATLLHDVGKAIGSTDHSQRGADMARSILARLGLPQEDIDEACHLIRKHLVMYHVATRRDLDDPATVAEFAGEVHGREGLRDLYLLTVADLSTTSPTSMTSWKARMLDELYLATDAALGGTASDGGRRQRAEEDVIREVLALPAASVAEREARRAFVLGFLGSMPERYLLANAPAAIAAHAELARKHEGRLVSVALVPSRHPEAAEICVIAADRPGLLAAITAAISASRLEVHAAQIHSRNLPGATEKDARVQAVDLFWVRDRGEGVEGVARALPKLARDLHAVLSGEVDATELAKRRAQGAPYARSGPRVGTQVSVDNRASPTHTVIEILARDRPGLLFTIADALYRLGLSIAVAKINTEGARVADVFYVSEDGSKISSGKRSVMVQERLIAVLVGMEHEGSSG